MKLKAMMTPVIVLGLSLMVLLSGCEKPIKSNPNISVVFEAADANGTRTNRATDVTIDAKSSSGKPLKGHLLPGEDSAYPLSGTVSLPYTYVVSPPAGYFLLRVDATMKYTGEEGDVISCYMVKDGKEVPGTRHLLRLGKSLPQSHSAGRSTVMISCNYVS